MCGLGDQPLPDGEKNKYQEPISRCTLQTRIHFSMHLSIVIPAFNEERLIERCLQSISASLAENFTPSFTSEIIVVDNNSTDNTANLARQAGAQVVFEPINQIGRARNAGAAKATGDWLLQRASGPGSYEKGSDGARKTGTSSRARLRGHPPRRRSPSPPDTW